MTDKKPRRLSSMSQFLREDLRWPAFKDRVRRELLANGHKEAANAWIDSEGSPLPDEELMKRSPMFVMLRELWKELGGKV